MKKKKIPRAHNSENRTLAKLIAHDLMTGGTGRTCQRLLLIDDAPRRREHGGWSEGPVADRIERWLNGELTEVTR